MRRKIIKQGHNTLTMTLPSEWVKKLNLKAGDEININEDNGVLIINGKQNKEFKSITLDITDLSIIMIWRFVQAAYREGYDEIKITYPPEQKEMPNAYHFYTSNLEMPEFKKNAQNKPVLNVLSDIFNRFVGFEIIDSGRGFCIAREMGDVTSKEFDNSFRRIFFLIQDLFEEIIEVVKEERIGEQSIYKTIHTMDTNIDRFIDYCCRINNKIKDSSFQKNRQLIFSSLFILELLGDEFKFIGIHLAKSKQSVKEILPFLEKIKSHFEDYYSLFYKFDKEKVINFGKNDFKIYNDHFKWKTSKKKDLNGIRKHLLQISKYILCLVELRIEIELSHKLS